MKEGFLITNIMVKEFYYRHVEINMKDNGLKTKEKAKEFKHY